MIGIMSAYAMGLLMDRKLIIKIKKPCLLEKYLMPNEIDWSFDHIPNYQNLSKDTLYISYNDGFVRDDLKNINFLNFKNNTNAILYRDGFNLIRHLTLNRNHHEKIKSLGYSVKTFNIENMFFDIYKKLFKFNENLSILFEKTIKKAKPNSNSKLVCAQIRIGGDGDFKFTERENSRKYWEFIKTNLTYNLNDYKLFITTDTSDVIDEANKVFGNERVFAFKQRSFHISRKVGRVENLNETECDRIAEIYLDFYMLGQCDMGVVSHSGFGLISILNRKDLKNLKNFYVFTNQQNLKKNFGNRNDLQFFQFDASILYAEFNYLQQ